MFSYCQILFLIFERFLKATKEKTASCYSILFVYHLDIYYLMINNDIAICSYRHIGSIEIFEFENV